MNADLKNSETMKNLMRAFAGESQARNRYTFAAGTAKKEGLPVVEAVFKLSLIHIFGFVTDPEGRRMVRVEQAEPGQQIEVRLTDGKLRAQVTGKERL